jgi:hypothetical protein
MIPMNLLLKYKRKLVLLAGIIVCIILLSLRFTII